MKVKDIIRKADDKELTDICLEMMCDLCSFKKICNKPIYPYVNRENCRVGVEQWLESEVTGNE